jgi:hypothetical protein
MRDQASRPAIQAPEAEAEAKARDKLREAHHALREALAAGRAAGWGGGLLDDVSAAQNMVAFVRSNLA